MIPSANASSATNSRAASLRSGLPGSYMGSCRDEPLMSRVFAPARCAAASTCLMAFSVEELARSVPPTATIYGESIGESYTLSPQLISAPPRPRVR